MTFWIFALVLINVMCFLVNISVLFYVSFGRIFNVAVTRIISTPRLDDRTFDQENSDKQDNGFCF